MNRQSSTLDIFITNVPHNFYSPEVIVGLGSDHLPVKCRLNSEAIGNNLTYRDFKNAKWNVFASVIKRDLGNPPNTLLSISECIDSALEHFTSTIKSSIEASAPLKTICHK